MIVNIDTSLRLLRHEMYIVREGNGKLYLHPWIYSYLDFSQPLRLRACFILSAEDSCWSLLWGCWHKPFCLFQSPLEGKKFSTCTRAVICENRCLFHHDKFIYTVPVAYLIMKFRWTFSIRVFLRFLSPLRINGAVICSIANTTRYYYFKHHVKLS